MLHFMHSLVMTPARIAFPTELFEPYEFENNKGIPCVCGVLIVRTLETATVVLVEMPDSPGCSLACDFERIAKQVYLDRLNDLPAWRVRWYIYSPDNNESLENIYVVTLEWVIGAAFNSSFNFRCLHWRELRSGEILVLLQELDHDIQRFGIKLK